MIRLSIDNSTSRISGLTVGQHGELKKLLSYEIDKQEAYYSGTWKTTRSLLGKRGDFPTGLLYIVEKWLDGRPELSETLDDRKVPERRQIFPTFGKTHQPYPEQVEAAQAALREHRGVISAPTGAGKSVILSLIIAALQVRTLVVVPSLELKRQLTEMLQVAFPDTRVGSFASHANIAVENVDALDPNVEANYDCVIVDEFHHSAAKTYRTLNKKAWTKVYYRFGLTATPFRANENERLLLESVLSKVIYRIDYKTAVSKGYIVPLEAYYVDLSETTTKGETWSEVYSDLVVNNSRRNDIIRRLLQTLFIAGKSTLCLVKEIEHGDALQDSTRFVHGQHPIRESMISNFNSGLDSCLIATTGVCGEGVDTKPAEYIIIAGLGKSKNAFMQQIGRGFRKYPGKESCKVILFRDGSHKWTLNHFKAQCKILRDEYGAKPVKLEVI